jgi:hypothetical protein
MRTWISGVVAALVGLIGLFIASRAHEGTFYYVAWPSRRWASRSSSP